MATKRKSPKKSVKIVPKNDVWFIAVRGSYLPANWKGWSTYIPFVGYLVFAMVAADQATDSISKQILLIVPNWIAALAIMTWIAKRTS